MKVVIQNHNDVPLKFQYANGYVTNYQMKAELDPDFKYFLVYGKKDDKAPFYDAVYFRDKIPEVVFPAVVLEEQKIIYKPPFIPVFIEKLWVWIGMVVVILVLSFFSWRMVREESGK